MDNTANLKARKLDDDHVPVFPVTLINRRIEDWKTDHHGAPQWLQSNSRIDKINPVAWKIKWKNTSRDITIDSDGNLSVQGEYNVEIAKNILRETNFGAMPDFDLPVVEVSSFLNAKSPTSYARGEERIKNYVTKAKIFALAPSFSGIGTEKSGQICLLLGQSELVVDNRGTNLVISLPEPPSKGLCYQDEVRLVCAARIEGHIGGLCRQIPVAYENNGDFSAFLMELAKKYYLRDRRMLKLLPFINGATYLDFYTPEYVRELLDSQEIQVVTPVDKILNRLLELGRKLQEVVVNLPMSSSSGKLRLALMRKNTEVLCEVRDWTKQWQEAVSQLEEKFGIVLTLNPKAWQDTSFGFLSGQVKQLAEAVASFGNNAATEGSENPDGTRASSKLSSGVSKNKIKKQK